MADSKHVSPSDQLQTSLLAREDEVAHHQQKTCQEQEDQQEGPAGRHHVVLSWDHFNPRQVYQNPSNKNKRSNMMKREDMCHHNLKQKPPPLQAAPGAVAACPLPQMLPQH